MCIYIYIYTISSQIQVIYFPISHKGPLLLSSCCSIPVQAHSTGWNSLYYYGKSSLITDTTAIDCPKGPPHLETFLTHTHNVKWVLRASLMQPHSNMSYLSSPAVASYPSVLLKHLASSCVSTFMVRPMLIPYLGKPFPQTMSSFKNQVEGCLLHESFPKSINQKWFLSPLKSHRSSYISSVPSHSLWQHGYRCSHVLPFMEFKHWILPWVLTTVLFRESEQVHEWVNKSCSLIKSSFYIKFWVDCLSLHHLVVLLELYLVPLPSHLV